MEVIPKMSTLEKKPLIYDKCRHRRTHTVHCTGRTGLSVQVRSFSIVNLQWMLVLMSTHQPVNYLGIGLATLASVTGNSRKKSTINDAMHKLHMAIYANRKWKFWMHCTTSMW